MKYMLDTNTCIYIIKKSPIKVYEKLKQLNISDVVISVITLNELEYGISKSSNIEKNRIALTKFLAPIDVMPYEENCTTVYGEIRTILEKKGKPIGSMDLMIASHALTLGSVLVTNNVKEFKRVPGLKIENWV